MDFLKTLLEQYQLMEGLESVITANPSIKRETIEHYHSTALPDNNKGDNLLRHILNMHKTGSITPETAHLLKPHLTALNNSGRLNQIKGLHTLDDHINATRDIMDKSVSKKQKLDIDTPIVYENNDIIIKQHKTHASAIKAAQLHPNNPLYDSTNEKGKAQWCVSSDSELGKKRFNTYTDNGKHPLYTITNKKTKSTHAIVANNDIPAAKVEFRNEVDANPTTVAGIKTISGNLYMYPGIEHSIVGDFLNKKFPEDMSTLKKLPHDANNSLIQNYIENGSHAEKISAYMHPNISNKQILHGLQSSSDERRMVLSNPKVPTNILDDYLKTEYNTDNIAAALRHPNISYNAVQDALNSKELVVHMTALQQHRHITPSNIDRAQDSSKSVIRAIAAMHPKISNTQLTRAVKDQDEVVPTLALQHSKVTPEHIEYTIDGNNSECINIALSHKNATNEHFNKVAKHDDAYVRNSLIDHPGIKKEQLEILSRDNVPSIANKAALKLKGLDKEH